MFNAGKNQIAFIFCEIYLSYRLSFIQFDSREMLPMCFGKSSRLCKDRRMS